MAPTLSRRAKISLAVLGVFVAIPALALIILLNYDWNRARPWLGARASEALQRPVELRGNLALTWQKPALPSAARSWREHIPWPHLVAQDVHIGNPAGLPPGDMAMAQSLGFSLSPFALLSRKIAIPELRFDQPQLDLLRQADGRNNWTLPKRPPSEWRLELDRLVFTRGSIKLDDAQQKLVATAKVDTLEHDARYGVRWTLAGTWNQQDISGKGKTGAVLALRDTGLPFPIQADAKVGLVSVAAEGTLTNPAQLAAIDLQLKVSGASAARLYALTGLLLPETPPFTTAGRLSGHLAEGASQWTYEKFTGRVGDSDIAGTLSYQQRQPRGLLTGVVHSRLLQFADLGPLIGADSNARKEERGVAAVQPAGKVLPVETFKTERWKALDADVSFQAERIVRTKELPLSKLHTEFHLKDGVLRLAPLDFDFAGGQVASSATLDGSSGDTVAATLDANASHIKLKQLLPKLPDLKQATIGEINAAAKLSAKGNSVAAMLAHSNGELKTLVNDGTVSKLLLEQMGLNIGNVVLTKMFGDKPVHLNCLAGDFGVRDGLAQTRYFIADTDDATVRINGAVNLASEQIDLTLKPDSKGLRIISLRAPIYVRGSLKQPDVDIDKGVIAMRAGGALALGVLAAPVAALAPLISAGGQGDNQCAALLAAAKEKPKAPPPGKPQR
ncbi:AsmA family protein [Pseudoduganella violaceinigra]|uniref:AsmA family protein n=1 Tax=Pseudoduganella violaceinigra TaxID=246602 RepID=UPI0005513A28|nr:AsmA family protein [Pseudoduganella violaceinigra]